LDTGAGIPPEDVPRIFERFYQVDKSRSEKTVGSGLGLAICKQIVEAHGGTLSAQSAVGVGTRMTMWLPAKTAQVF
jgi:signal transduction histidine kinase